MPAALAGREGRAFAAGGLAAGNALSSPAMKLLFKWLLSAAALLLVAYLYNGVEVRSFTGALMAAFVIGLFNAVLRPVLKIRHST